MELIFICAQPSDLYYAWEVEVMINNFRKYGYSDKLHVLVYEPDQNGDRLTYRQYWKELKLKYPEVGIFFYPDQGVRNLLPIYIPVLRPHVLKQHFEAYPELKDKAIFYHDSDIIFTKFLDFDQFLHDDVCYLSDTQSYISASYFDSKAHDVLPTKLERYKKKDILADVTGLVGITPEIARANEAGTGGAQYLLKGVDADFWAKVEKDCIALRIYLLNANKTYFKDENTGFQSWCADMWAVLWGLWARGYKTECPEELKFCWATSLIEEWDKHYIFHNAGVASTAPIQHNGEDHYLFYKGDPPYKRNIITPFDEPKSKWDNISKAHCSYKYLEELLSVPDPLCIEPKISH